MNESMLDRLVSMENRYEELGHMLMDPDIGTDIKKMTDVTKEQASLQAAYDLFQEYKEVKDGIDGAKELMKENDPEIKEMAKDDDRIIFTGFVQGEELDELYSNAYVYTLPSDLEGMPLSLLEAMSYGNCCLVSDIDECASVVEDKALVFEKSNVEQLQEKLQEACDKPKMVKKYKEEAADFICEKYNWDDVVEKTMELYRG